MFEGDRELYLGRKRGVLFERRGGSCRVFDARVGVHSHSRASFSCSTLAPIAPWSAPRSGARRTGRPASQINLTVCDRVVRRARSSFPSVCALVFGDVKKRRQLVKMVWDGEGFKALKERLGKSGG